MPRKRVLSFDVPEHVQRQLKARAALDGTSIGLLLLAMLERRGIGG